MKVLIIEDEFYAAKRLTALIEALLPNVDILEILDSVEESIKWFNSNNEPDLIFMDIQLADGLSFKIFEEIKFASPVIFITAFDEYAIDAFKLNSIDYLLKPVETDKLEAAISKFNKIKTQSSIKDVNWKELGLSLYANKGKFKKRFLIKTGKAYQYLSIEDIALLYSEDGISFAINVDGKRFLIDNTLDKISESLDPALFFRISRKHIVSITAIGKIHPFLNSRLKLEIKQNLDQELLVSREKVKSFKTWLEG